MFSSIKFYYAHLVQQKIEHRRVKIERNEPSLVTFASDGLFNVEGFLFVTSGEAKDFFSEGNGKTSSTMMTFSSPQIEAASLPDSSEFSFNLELIFSFSETL